MERLHATLDSDVFTSDLVRGYLRTLQKSDHPESVVYGEFLHRDEPYFWGMVAEYGSPPSGCVVIELWKEDEPEEAVHIRAWHSQEKESGKLVRSNAVRFSELRDPQ